jgi:trans-AT polyketide synthase/acyltransferase/oxidoreductase domain-containing protein
MTAYSDNDVQDIRGVLAALDEPCFVVRTERGVAAANTRPSDAQVLAAVPPLPPERLGSPDFLRHHGVRYAYMAGSMANGIASEEHVAALAKAGYLGSFGAAGLLPERIEQALRRLGDEIPGLPFASNLIHSPHEDRLEREAVDLYLKYGVRCVEASAFIDLTPHLVRYRVAGLSRAADGRTAIANRVIGKVSRTEVAERFMRPPPESTVAGLVAAGQVSAEQAELAKRVPMADDVTVEADSGGHTDRRPLGSLFPVLLRLRDELGREVGVPVRLGAAGGIGTPDAAWAAFALGADYVVTGSVNQACVEAGTSDVAKRMLAAADVADCEMAPAADMFELGVTLQVLRKGAMFPMRAKWLHELYRTHESIDELSTKDRERLETQVLRRSVDDVWQECADYFARRDPEQLDRAEGNPKRRMALIFRWYLGMSSRWAKTGDEDRAGDFQIWCGPAMGAFNDWTAGTHLAAPGNRRVADAAHHIMRGAAYAGRVAQLRLAGVRLPAACTTYRPEPVLEGV